MSESINTMRSVLFHLQNHDCDVNCLAKEHDTQGDRGITCSIFSVYVHEYWQDNSVHVTHTHSDTVIITQISSTEHIYKMGSRANTG